MTGLWAACSQACHQPDFAHCMSSICVGSDASASCVSVRCRPAVPCTVSHHVRCLLPSMKLAEPLSPTCSVKLTAACATYAGSCKPCMDGGYNALLIAAFGVSRSFEATIVELKPSCVADQKQNTPKIGRCVCKDQSDVECMKATVQWLSGRINACNVFELFSWVRQYARLYLNPSTVFFELRWE